MEHLSLHGTENRQLVDFEEIPDNLINATVAIEDETFRVGIASQALGIAQGAMDETVKYVKERKQFGRTIGQFQNTQFQLADLDTKIEAARLLVRAAAFKKDQKLPFSVDAARAKLFAAETAMEVTTKAVQFHGGYGYTREYPVERMMRDAKITEIYEGTSEVQRMVISSALLK